MANDRHRMKEAMMVLTLTTFVFLAAGVGLSLIFLLESKQADSSSLRFVVVLCFVVVAVALLSVRHVLRAIDRRLTSLEQEIIDRRAAEHQKGEAD